MADEALPMVSCIMPTCDRREFVSRAIALFQKQSYPHKELIVVDDGVDAVGDLMPTDERIKYIRIEQRMSVGGKRNIACNHARSPLIAHWDDDDWHAERRLAYQVDKLMRSSAAVCGLKTLLFVDVRDGRAWRYDYPERQRGWLSGNSLMYRREFWERHRFAEINVGEDGRFVWSAGPGELLALEDWTIHVGVIHGGNVSPKQVETAWWRRHSAEEIRGLMGTDWGVFVGELAAIEMVERGAGETRVTADVKPVRNVFACLVHENPDCIVDLVKNLRHLDPTSRVVLYNGSADAGLLDAFVTGRHGVEVHPSPRAMAWGKLHEFALECMRYALKGEGFETLTIVDSDQLAVRGGYSQRLAEALAGRARVGMLGNCPGVQPATTTIGPAKAAFAEVELWRRLARRYPGGEGALFHWTFWPSTVFTAEAARELVRVFEEDEELRRVVAVSKIWATEEVILPTVTALLGFEIGRNPASDDYVKYRSVYTPKQVEMAMGRADVFWVHPVARRYDDVLRKLVREKHGRYVRERREVVMSPPMEGKRLLTSREMFARIRGIEGWLSEGETDLLLAACTRAMLDCPGVSTVVEVGSYCGRATVVLAEIVRAYRKEGRVWAIDPHDGRIGAVDRVVTVAPSLGKLEATLANAGAREVVEVVQGRVRDVVWEAGEIGFLLIDGFHDYGSVVRDFVHFERALVNGGYVAFHDCAAYYPGVVMLVEELVAAGGYVECGRAESLVVLRKVGGAASRSG